MSDLGSTLRTAREHAGLSLAGMARRTGYSRSYLGNVESGTRRVTPALIRAYESALADTEGQDMQRRNLLRAATAAMVATTVPDVAVDVVRDIAAERSRLLSSVLTSHATDRVIAQLIARDQPCVVSLTRWVRKGSPVLRVNSAGILAKLGAPIVDDGVIAALRVDQEARTLYLQAVTSRVLGLPWDDAGDLAVSGRPLPESGVALFADEVRNPYDSGARWCSVVMLARTRPEDPSTVDSALTQALRSETSIENLRTIAGALAGLDPLTI